MLQQTQVAVVVPYFLRWMELFPTIQSLAEASLDTVIKCWEGLGYYSRARALHAGANYIMQHFQGILPSSDQDLAKIKGIGPYTAGAIRSFAFQQKAPAVDGNVIRVLTRYFHIADDVCKPATVKKIWALATAILPENEPWVFNEALIELGATICTRKPNCTQCPLKLTCRAFAEGDAAALPVKSKKMPIENLYRAVAVIHAEGMLLVKKVDEGQLMGGLHEFPYFDAPAEGLTAANVEKRIHEALGLKVAFQHDYEEVAHSFTRYRVRLTPASFTCPAALPVEGYAWKSGKALEDLAFSSGHRRIYAMLCVVLPMR